VKIEYISRIRLTSWWSLQKEGQCPVRYGVLGQIVIYDQYILSFVHEILRKGRTRIWRNILKRRAVAGCCGKHGCIIHSSIFFKSGNQLRNRRRLLSDCNINADHILTLLVEDRVCGDRRLSCLTVSDNQLTLSAPDREHGIDRKDSRLKRYGNRFSVYDRRSRILDRPVFLSLDLTLAVDRRAKGIDNTSDISLACRNTCALSGTEHPCTFPDLTVIPEQNTSDAVLTDILHHTFQSVLKGHDLTVSCMVDAVDRSNSVSDADDSSDFLVLADLVIIRDFFF